MMKFVLDVAVPTPSDIIFEMGGWIPLSVVLLIIGGLIYVFIRNNRDKQMLEDWEKEHKDKVDE